MGWKRVSPFLPSGSWRVSGPHWTPSGPPHSCGNPRSVLWDTGFRLSGVGKESPQEQGWRGLPMEDKTHQELDPGAKGGGGRAAGQASHSCVYARARRAEGEDDPL